MGLLRTLLSPAFAVTAAIGAVLERALYRHLYGKPHLDQVLFSIGLTFMAVAAVDWAAGSSPVTVQTPEWLRGRFEWGEGAWQLGMGHYRLFVIGVCLALAVSLQTVLTRTRFGSRLRAAVDDPRVAAGLGIPVNKVFLLTFATGSGLAGLGGALGVDILGMDPREQFGLAQQRHGDALAAVVDIGLDTKARVVLRP